MMLFMDWVESGNYHPSAPIKAYRAKFLQQSASSVTVQVV